MKEIVENLTRLTDQILSNENLTVSENIEFYGGVYGLSRPEIKTRGGKLITTLGLGEEASKLVSALPLGWKQKLAFSIAVFHRPKIVFLDEPTGGVDPVTRRQFWDLIYAETLKGMTVFVTTHYMDEAEYCNRISIMVDGRIEGLGTPSDLRNRYQASTMDEVFYKMARRAERTES